MASNVTDTDDFPNVIVTPEGGDFVTGAGLRVPVQGLSNRTRNLKNRLDNIIATIAGQIITWTAPHIHTSNVAIQSPGQLILSGQLADITYLPAREFILNVPLSSGKSSDPKGVIWDDERWAWFWTPGAIRTPVIFPVPLFRSATVTKLELMIDGTQYHDCNATMKRRVLSWIGSGSAPNGGSLRVARDVPLANGMQIVQMTPAGDQTIAPHLHDYKLAVSLDNLGTPAEARLYGIRCTYTMGGPPLG